ncbi:MAG: hypothetical protein Q7S03_03465 [bacterium]|nr:hypothetical protein [bacterium]
MNGLGIKTEERSSAAQKIIYILKASSVNLGYTFSWDVGGPYSRGLSKDVEICERENEELLSYLKLHRLVFKKAVRPRVNLARSLMIKPRWANAISALAWLDLVSSLLFRRDELDNFCKREVVKEITDRKPHFRPCQEIVEQAWDYLEANLPSKTAAFA